MKHFSLPLFALCLPLLCGCGGSSSSPTSSATSAISADSSIVSSSSSAVAYDTAALAKKYGDFSITIAEAGVGSYTYDEANNVYTLAVASAKAEYVLSGYFSGTIKIENPSSVGSFKGVTLTLQGACLVGEGNAPVIYYTLDSKKVEVKAKKDTSNMVLALGTGNAILSENNVELSGKGSLELASLGGDAHTVKASGTIRLYSAPNILVSYSDHDAFHANYLDFMEDPSDVTSSKFTGTLTVNRAVSQAFDMETSGGNGYAHLQSGNVFIHNVVNVFKVDKEIIISSDAKVVATDVAEEPYIHGEATSSVALTVEGTFTVDGVPVQ